MREIWANLKLIFFLRYSLLKPMLTSLWGSGEKPSLRDFQLEQSTKNFVCSSDLVSTKRPDGTGSHAGGRQKKAATCCVGFQLTCKKEKISCFKSLTLPSVLSLPWHAHTITVVSSYLSYIQHSLWLCGCVSHRPMHSLISATRTHS